MEPISISAFIMALISSFVLFIKGIRICKCNKGGFEIERDVNYDIEQQQEYTLKLIKALKNSYTPRKEYKDSIENEQNIKYVNMEEKDKEISELISDLEQEIENNKKNKQINHKKNSSREYIESKLLKFTGISTKTKSNSLNNEKLDPNIPNIQLDKIGDNKNITQFISKKNK